MASFIVIGITCKCLLSLNSLLCLKCERSRLRCGDIYCYHIINIFVLENEKIHHNSVVKPESNYNGRVEESSSTDRLQS